jgi:hypothetical protein
VDDQCSCTYLAVKAAIALTAIAITLYGVHKVYQNDIDESLLEQIYGGFNDATVDEGDGFEVFEVTVSLKLTTAAAEYMRLHNITFETLVKAIEKHMELAFNNALRPFRQRVNFVFFWSAQPIEFVSEWMV